MREVPRAQVLLAEDDFELRRLVHQYLVDDGFDVVSVAGGGMLVAYLGQALDARDPLRLPDVVVTDVRMPQYDGLSVLTAMRARAPTLPFVLVTAFGDETLRRAARELGAEVLDKPFELEQLARAIAAALAARDERAAG